MRGEIRDLGVIYPMVYLDQEEFLDLVLAEPSFVFHSEYEISLVEKRLFLGAF